MDYYNYKLTIINTPYFYSGSSKLYQKSTRINNHKSDCYGGTHMNIKLYKKIRELGITKKDFYDRVILTKILTGMDKKQSIIAENSLIDLSNPFCLNDRNENVDRVKNDKEYTKKFREVNKEEIKEYQKNKYQEDREDRLSQAEVYRNNNKDKINAKCLCDNCGISSYKRGLDRHKKTKYCIDYQKNKDTWIKCECGMILKDKYKLKRHKLSKKHINQYLV